MHVAPSADLFQSQGVIYMHHFAFLKFILRFNCKFISTFSLLGVLFHGMAQADQNLTRPEPLPQQRPTLEQINSFLDDGNLLHLADDFGIESVLFLRNDAEDFRNALTPQNFFTSWQKPVDAGPLILRSGRLFPRDFYRSTAYSRMGQKLIDPRAPHEIGKEQWSISVTPDGLFLEGEFLTDSTKIIKKGVATKLLLRSFLDSINGDTVTLYRGVHGKEGKAYKDMNLLLQKKGQQQEEIKNFIARQLKPISLQSNGRSGTFVTPSKEAAESFGTRSEDVDPVLIKYTINKNEIKNMEDQIYIGFEENYIEISFSSSEATELLLNSVSEVRELNQKD